MSCEWRDGWASFMKCSLKKKNCECWKRLGYDPAAEEGRRLSLARRKDEICVAKTEKLPITDAAGNAMPKGKDKLLNKLVAENGESAAHILSKEYER